MNIDLTPYTTKEEGRSRINTKMIPAEKSISIFEYNSQKHVKLSNDTVWTLMGKGDSMIQREFFHEDTLTFARRIFYKKNVFVAALPGSDIFDDNGSFLKELPSITMLALDVDDLYNKIVTYSQDGENEIYLYLMYGIKFNDDKRVMIRFAVNKKTK